MREGLGDGMLVVGRSVGLGEGSAEGIWLGAGLGNKDGFGLGILVGYIVGDGDGFRVGPEESTGLLPGVGITVGDNDTQQCMMIGSDPVTTSFPPLYSFQTDFSPITGSSPSYVCSRTYI